MGTTTTQCSYSHPVDATGAFPASSTPFVFASSTCTALTDLPAATGTVPIVYTMSAGDVLIGFFLFVLILMNFIGFTLRTNGTK